MTEREYFTRPTVHSVSAASGSLDRPGIAPVETRRDSGFPYPSEDCSISRTPLACAVAWRATILALWREATYREQRYAAIELAVHRPGSPPLGAIAAGHPNSRLDELLP